MDLSFLLPPKTSYTDHYAIAKFDLTWKMVVFNSVFLFIVMVGYFFFEPDAFLAAMYGWLVAIGLNAALWHFKKYKVIGFIYALHGCLFLVYTLNFMPTVIHAIEFFWMIVFTLYTFLPLEKSWLFSCAQIFGSSQLFLLPFSGKYITPHSLLNDIR
ncbi:MAG: hypothetical protein IPM77_15790 [Crocinitomicaceae bacterium]|nr:hypothetical protein [Crocinitomicaceae bacterium]